MQYERLTKSFSASSPRVFLTPGPHTLQKHRQHGGFPRGQAGTHARPDGLGT